MKSISSSELRTTMPARAMTPIIEVAVNACWVIQCPGNTPTRVSGIAPITISGIMNDL